MDYVWASLVILTLFLAQLLQLFGGPANWVVLGLAALWKYLYPGSMEWSFVIVLGVMAVVAEGLEFGLQAWSAGRYGASRKGNIGGMIGAIVGAIFGAGFLLGFGALLGALAGAYAGCLIAEMPGKPMPEARHAALGAFWGKAFGFTVKMSIGAAMVVLAIPRIWP